MKLFDAKLKIMQLTRMDISQAEIAEALGITRQTINKRINTNSNLTVDEIKKLEEAFKINLTLSDAELQKEIKIDLSKVESIVIKFKE